MNRINYIFVLLVFVSFFGHAQHRILGLGKWTLGMKYSLERSGLILKDNPRANIDSTFELSDSLYIVERQTVENIKWNYTVGLTFDYRMKNDMEFCMGLNFVKNGTEFQAGEVTQPGLAPIFDWMNPLDTIKTKNNYLEIPFMFKKKLAPSVKHEKSMTGFRLLSLRRILYGALGVSLSYPINDKRFWNEIEYSGSDPSIGVNGVGALGIHHIFKSRLSIDVGVNFRYNFTPMYPYAPVLTRYYSYGIHCKLAYTLKHKPPKTKKRVDLSCRNFIHTPQPKDELYYQYGFIFGVNQVGLKGPSLDNEFIGLRAKALQDINTVTSHKGETKPFYGGFAGLRFEYFVAPKYVSLGFEGTYSQKGLITDYEYFGTDHEGRDVKMHAYARTFIDYVDLSISLKVKPIPHVFLMGGLEFSLPVGDEVYGYHQVTLMEKDPLDHPIFNDKRVGLNKLTNYWGAELSTFTMGPMLGFGVEVDNYLDVMVRYHMTNYIFEKNTHELKFNMLQLTFYYNMFNRKIFREE